MASRWAALSDNASLIATFSSLLSFFVIYPATSRTELNQNRSHAQGAIWKCVSEIWGNPPPGLTLLVWTTGL